MPKNGDIQVVIADPICFRTIKTDSRLNSIYKDNIRSCIFYLRKVQIFLRRSDMFSVNFLFFLTVLIFSLLFFVTSVRRLEENRLLVAISRAVVLVILLSIGLSILFPLDVLRFVTRNPSIPTSQELGRQMKQVQNAIQPFARDGFVFINGARASIDLDIKLEIPNKCGFYSEELKGFDASSAAREISAAVRLYTASDDELLKACEALTPSQKKELVQLRQNSSLADMPHLCADEPISLFGSFASNLTNELRLCALDRISPFGSFASNAQFGLLKQHITAKNLLPSVMITLEKIAPTISADLVDTVIELLYSSDN